MKINYKIREFPVILFLILLLYIIIIFIFAKSEIKGDEVGYSTYAENITKGFYAGGNDINIWWGPGYPLFLAALKILHLPVIIIKLFNAVFFFIAVLLFYKTLLFFTDEKKAQAFSFILGLWPPYIREMVIQNSEALSSLLICLLLYLSVLIFRKNEFKFKYYLITGIVIGYLALTKVIFGYVILANIIILIIAFPFFKNRFFIKSSLLIFIISLIFCVPYLIYTYNLTGKVFFWTNGGGTNLYHSATPFTGEYGDWMGNNVFDDNEQARINHKKMLEETKDMKMVGKDEMLKKMGIENLKNHPVKFVYNWFCGIGRLMFNYPYSYSYQKLDTYFFILPNIFLFIFLFFSIGIFIRHRNLFPRELSFIVLLSVVYFGGISVVAAVARYTAIFYPLFFIIILFVFTRIVKIQKIESL
jgi:4-amino-4-deoxy-L-arabinose transferase-like glycosyltransferase